MTHSIMSHSIMSHSIMTHSITTLNILDLISALSFFNSQYYDIQRKTPVSLCWVSHFYCYADCRIAEWHCASHFYCYADCRNAECHCAERHRTSWRFDSDSGKRQQLHLNNSIQSFSKVEDAFSGKQCSVVVTLPPHDSDIRGSTPSPSHLKVVCYMPSQGILKGEVSLYCWPPVWLVWIILFCK